MEDISSLILNHLVVDEEYTRKVIPFIKNEYFQEEEERLVFDLVHKFLMKYNKLPTKEALLIDLSNKENLSQGSSEKSKTFIHKIEEKKIDPQWMLDQTEDFCKKRAIYNALMKSVEIYGDKSGKHSINAIPALLQEALGVSFDTRLGHSFLDDYEARFKYYHLVEHKIPFDIDWLNLVTGGGVSKKTLNIMAGGQGGGKAQPLDLIIPSPQGSIKFGSLRVGDMVFGSNGKPTTILKIHPQGTKDIYSISFSDGRKTECCDEHLWKTFTSRKLWKIQSTKEIIQEWENNKRSRKNTYIQLTEAVDSGIKSELDVNPYILGLFIGDGYSGKGGINLTTYDISIAKIWCEYFENSSFNVKITRKKSRKAFCVVKKNGQKNLFKEILLKLNLFNKRSYEKEIPQKYMQSSANERFELLRGLLDTDGTVGTHQQISYTSTSQKLALQVVDLVRSLGGFAKITSRITSYIYKGEKRSGKTSYTVRIRINRNQPLFNLYRKQERLNTTYQYDSLKLRIEKIEYIGEKECQCIEVDAKDHLYLTNDYIVTHNSLSMCHFASYNLLSGKNVLFISLEMSEEEIAKRIDANTLDIPMSDLNSIPWDSYEAKMSKLRSKTQGKLIIREFPNGSAGSANFRYLINELNLKQDFVPDVIYIDYMNICSSSRVKLSSTRLDLYVKYISEELRGLAQEFNLPVITANQFNKAGYMSSDPDLSDNSDSFLSTAAADFTCAIINSEELSQLGQTLFKQTGKNRYYDITQNVRGVIGIDRTKMRLYNVDPKEQNGISGGTDSNTLINEINKSFDKKSIKEFFA